MIPCDMYIPRSITYDTTIQLLDRVLHYIPHTAIDAVTRVTIASICFHFSWRSFGDVKIAAERPVCVGYESGMDAKASCTMGLLKHKL